MREVRRQEDLQGRKEEEGKVLGRCSRRGSNSRPGPSKRQSLCQLSTRLAWWPAVSQVKFPQFRSWWPVHKPTTKLLNVRSSTTESHALPTLHQPADVNGTSIYGRPSSTTDLARFQSCYAAAKHARLHQPNSRPVYWRLLSLSESRG